MYSYLSLSPSPLFIFAFCQSLIYANIIRLSLLSIQTDLHSRHSLLTYTASLSLSDSYTTYIYIVFPLSHTYTNTYIQVQHLSLKYLPMESLSLSDPPEPKACERGRYLMCMSVCRYVSAVREIWGRGMLIEIVIYMQVGKSRASLNFTYVVI